MGILKNRWLTIVTVLMVLILVPACVRFRSEDAQGQQVSLLVPTETNTPFPTATDEPADEATERPTAGDLPISNNPTDTATPTPTETATPTATDTEVVAVAQAGDEGQLQPTDTPDTFALTATQIIVESTQAQAIILTATAAALIGETDTPVPTLTPTLEEGQPVTQPLGVDCVHEVRAGETMYSLSRYYGVSVADIANRNGVVNWNLISIGQRLIIPGCGTTGALPPATSTPTPTLTPFTLTTTNGTGGPGLGDPNPGGDGTTATAAGVGVGCVQQYTVQQYDTLFQISVNFGVSVQSIANANAITNINRIDMGTVLCIPSA